MAAERVRERVDALLAVLAGREVAQLSDDELVDVARLAGEAARSLGVIAAEVAAETGERMLHLRLAERRPADAMAAIAGVALDEARAWCTVGEAIRPRVTLSGEVLQPQHPALAEAVKGGSVGMHDAMTILGALDRVAPFASADRLLDVERVLVEHAPGLSRRDVARMARRAVDVLDPDGAQPREDLLRVRSGVRVHRTPDGLVRWVLTMHPEAAGFLTAAVDARTAPRRLPRFLEEGQDTDPIEHDVRPLAQRRLDALVDLARESMAHDTGSVAGAPVTLVVTIPLADLRSGLGSAEIAGVDEPVSAATARRLACDAEIIPVVLGTESEILDQGRATRLFTTAQRRAMAVRDGGCVWPGCNAPPGWCEAAHLTAWIDGGMTDLSNGVLLCAFHHRQLDREGWLLVRRQGELYLIPPGHVDAQRTPRRAGRLPEVA